ncbi:hypothetical protein Tco_0201020 [Tanacetum coccineum]
MKTVALVNAPSTDFMKCNPLILRGTEGVVGSQLSGFKKMESVFSISNCIVACQVKFATCTLEKMLEWRNSHVKTNLLQSEGYRVCRWQLSQRLCMMPLSSPPELMDRNQHICWKDKLRTRWKLITNNQAQKQLPKRKIVVQSLCGNLVEGHESRKSNVEAKAVTNCQGSKNSRGKGPELDVNVNGQFSYETFTPFHIS